MVMPSRCHKGDILQTPLQELMGKVNALTDKCAILEKRNNELESDALMATNKYGIARKREAKNEAECQSTIENLQKQIAKLTKKATPEYNNDEGTIPYYKSLLAHKDKIITVAQGLLGNAGYKLGRDGKWNKKA